MRIRDRLIDVELTNRCNALCSFCPRDVTPAQGFMSFETFSKIIERVKALDVESRVTLTGQGESTLHPQLLEFVRHAAEQGINPQMTTNANLLDLAMSRSLLEAGLGGVTFSISDFGRDYELVYNLDFERTRRNILDFLEECQRFGERRIETYVSIVEHDLNAGSIEEMRRFWLDAGVDKVLVFEQNNRGGACDNGHYFIGNDTYREEAEALFAARETSTLCPAPFHFVLIGWNGQYYICCSDYKKTTPLGSVFDYAIDAMDEVKLDSLGCGIQACTECNMDPVNSVREKLFEIEHGDATADDLEKVLDNFRANGAQHLSLGIDTLNWKSRGGTVER